MRCSARPAVCATNWTASRVERGAIQSGGKNLHEQWLAEAELVVARRSAAAQPLPSVHVPEPVRIDGPLLPGDTVWVPSLGRHGKVWASAAAR